MSKNKKEESFTGTKSNRSNKSKKSQKSQRQTEEDVNEGVSASDISKSSVYTNAHEKSVKFRKK